MFVDNQLLTDNQHSFHMRSKCGLILIQYRTVKSIYITFIKPSRFVFLSGNDGNSSCFETSIIIFSFCLSVFFLVLSSMP